MQLVRAAIKEDIKRWLKEDDLNRNLFYTQNLPEKKVKARLKIKSDLVLSGLPWFIETFRELGSYLNPCLLENEGRALTKGAEIEIGELPFAVALTAERLGLNLLQMSSSVSTFTSKFVQKADSKGIKILDTRKTIPGLRSLQKYAVRRGGGFNHRFGPTELWMVKDNHKSFFGGVIPAVDFFRSQGALYSSILVEIHDLQELKEVMSLGIRFVMLDNFSPDEVKKAIEVKTPEMHYEVSGGINLQTLDSYLIDGVDAISIGSLTYGAPSVDISFKF